MLNHLKLAMRFATVLGLAAGFAPPALAQANALVPSSDQESFEEGAIQKFRQFLPGPLTLSGIIVQTSFPGREFDEGKACSISVAHAAPSGTAFAELVGVTAPAEPDAQGNFDNFYLDFHFPQASSGTTLLGFRGDGVTTLVSSTREKDDDGVYEARLVLTKQAGKLQSATVTYSGVGRARKSVTCVVD